MARSSESNSLLQLDTIKNIDSFNIGIIYTEWNDKIVAEQLRGALRIATQTKANIVFQKPVPGCFELPNACKQMISKSYSPIDAIIVFGAVIRGGTPHFEYVSKAVTDGILQLNIQQKIPIIFGVLTLDNEAQAWERLGGSHGHKGEEAMITAIKMVHFSRSF